MWIRAKDSIEDYHKAVESIIRFEEEMKKNNYKLDNVKFIEFGEK